MGTVPVEITWVTGQVVTAAELNSNVRDAVSFLAAPPFFVGRQTVGQAIITHTFVPVLFDATDFDHEGGHSTVTNTSRYTSLTAGQYLCTGAVAWATGAGTRRITNWQVNGSAVAASRIDNVPVSGAQTAVAAASRPIFLNVGDYVELGAFQDTGSALSTFAGSDLESLISVTWVSG